jgi:hypothetical protein
MRRLLLALAIVAAMPVGAATDYYVGVTSCSDGGACTSAGAPCCNISACMGKMTGDNDRCLLSNSETLTNQTFIDSTMPGTCSTSCYVGALTGTATLNWTVVDNQDTTAIWKLVSWSNLTLKNMTITVQPSTVSGRRIFWMVGGTGNTFDNVNTYMTPNNQGRFHITATGTTNLTIKNAEMLPLQTCQTNCASNCAGTGGSQSCDFVCEQDQISLDGDTNPVMQNLRLGYTRRPILLSNVTNFTLERSHITDALNHGAPEADDSSGTIQNNIYDFDTSTSCQARTGARCGIDSFCGNDLTIAYNTFAVHGASIVGSVIQMYGGTGPDTDCTANGGQNAGTGGPNSHGYARWKVYGNIFYDGTGSLPFLDTSSITTDYFYSGYNLYSSCPGGSTCSGIINGSGGRVATYSCAAWSSTGTPILVGPDATHEGVNDVCSAPTFTTYTSSGSALADDLRAPSGAAAQVAVGSTRGDATFPCPTTDYLGNSRPASSACTIGAYEYGAGGAASPNTVKGVTARGAVIR